MAINRATCPTHFNAMTPLSPHPQLSSWALCPGPIGPLGAEQKCALGGGNNQHSAVALAAPWILGTSPRMTGVCGSTAAAHHLTRVQ